MKGAMETWEALGRLRGYLSEIEHLKTLRLSPDNQEYRRWKNRVTVVLEAAFTKDSDEYRNFGFVGGGVSRPSMTDADKQGRYLRDLERDKLAITEILDKYEILGIPASPKVVSVSARGAVPPKAFIAHGGETPALNKLKQFLNALGVIPIIAEEQPSEDRSIGAQVTWCLDQCDCAIILATKGDIDGRTGEFLPRGNILIEIGKCQERFPGRIVYLIESDTKFPSNISEKVRARFSPQSMDKAFIKVAKELTAFTITQAVKPE